MYLKKLNNLKHFLVLGLFTLVMLLVYQPTPFLFSDVNLGDVSNNNIIAPKTVTYVDKDATEDLLKQELEQVDNIYDKDQEVFESLKDNLKMFQTSLMKYQSELDKKKNPKISDVKNPFGLDNKVLKSIAKENPNTFSNFVDYVENELRKVYDVGLLEDQIKQTREVLKADSNLFLFPKPLREDLYNNILIELESNQKLNIEETEKAKNEIERELEPIYKKITKGEAVVRKHEEITEDHLHKLDELGLLDKQINLLELFLSLPTIILVLLLFHFYCAKFMIDSMSNLKTYSVTLFLFSLVVFTTRIIIGTDWYMIPVLTMLIMMTMFWKRSFLLIVTVVLSLLINNGDVVILMLILISGFSLSILHNKFKGFTDSLKHGLTLGLIVAISLIFLNLTFEQRFDLTMIFQMILSGIFSGIIATGLIPFVESMLGRVTVYKLTELNRLDHPVLEELYERAQGTFDHSRNVAHLASVAASEIGANSLLVRVAALYHDVGKMKNPEYFIENSTPEDNINNKVSPYESAEKILKHPLDSVEMCKKEKFPDEVLRIIERHHGDSFLEHFYKKALAEDEEIRKEDFQYKTHPPVSKEETILMLADVTEAYSRVFQDLSYDELKIEISSMIDNKIEAGDLRMSELTIKEINTCVDVFCKSLTASSHKRIKY